jgi:hypothetical protein
MSYSPWSTLCGREDPASNMAGTELGRWLEAPENREVVDQRSLAGIGASLCVSPGG